MIFERPVKGNPHQFVIKQHFHTAYSIGKFHGNDEKLDVYINETGETARKYKRSSIFCTKRNWDQKTEVSKFFAGRKTACLTLLELKPLLCKDKSRQIFIRLDSGWGCCFTRCLRLF